MAKYFATEAAQENALDCMRIHGGFGYSLEYRPERYYRDAPLLLIGEVERDPAVDHPRGCSNGREAETDFSPAPELTEVRVAVRELCAGFPGEYWRSLEPDLYPEGVVQALDRERLARALIPGVRGRRPVPHRGECDLEEINASAAFRRLPCPDVHHGHDPPARLDEQKQRYLPKIASGELRPSGPSV